VHYLKPRLAKLPLPPDEIARIHGYRDIIDNLVHKINEVALITHAEIIEEAAARKAARAAAAAQPAEPPPPKPAPPKPAPPKPASHQPQQPRPKPPETPQANPAPRPRRDAKPEAFLLHLVRAIDTCVRLDAFLADRLANAHTTAEKAGLNHPNRQPILDYMHKMVRFEEPYPFQRTTHDSIETRITEELAWAPNRNPADIIVEICTHLNIPFDPKDFPNNWRPSPPEKPPPKPREDPDFNDPAAAEEFYKTVQAELENRRLRGLDE
jgi:hypothetical protein